MSIRIVLFSYPAPTDWSFSEAIIWSTVLSADTFPSPDRAERDLLGVTPRFLSATDGKHRNKLINTIPAFSSILDIHLWGSILKIPTSKSIFKYTILSTMIHIYYSFIDVALHKMLVSQIIWYTMRK